MTSIQLGDMQVIDAVSPKMLKALATIAAQLHPAYNELEDMVKVDQSKQSCLFSSLVVRRFLVSVGFEDAAVQPCMVKIRSAQAGKELWSLGIGAPDDSRDIPGKFPGHVAVAVPSEQILIDTTLYQAIRSHWHGALTGMMALPLHLNPAPVRLPTIAGATLVKDDIVVEIAWYARPEIKWRRQFDAFDPHSMNRQRRLAKVLQETFGEWHEG
jgi:hypothetical protein